MTRPIKLHLGCGPKNFGDEWIHIDGGEYSHVDYHDVTRLPFDYESVDLIYASHLLEYFDRVEAMGVLGEWYRVLKKGGVLRLSVPDFRILVTLYLHGREIDLNRILGPLYGRMHMGGKIIYHKTAYDEESLTFLLHRVGFDVVRRWNWRETEHSNIDDFSQAYIPHMAKEDGIPISLNLEAVK